MNQILVVEDDVEIAEALKEYLENLNGFKIKLCHTAEDAITYLSSNKVDLIISDIKMPQKSGLELYEIFKKEIDTDNLTPFILVTGFADIITVQNAFKIGVDELIAKPYDLEAVALVVNYLLEKDSSKANPNEDFFSVPIEEFMLSKTSDYNIFLKVDQNFIRVTKSGQDFTSERLSNFAKKGATHVYLNSEDFAKYTDLHFAISKTVIKRPIEEVKKIRIMNQLMSAISQNSVAKEIDKKFLNNSLVAFECYTSVSLKHSQINSIIEYIQNDNPSLADKSALKAIISHSIITLWKWRSPKAQSRVILSALLADIGLKDHKELLNKTKFEYSPDERKAYEQHPVRSFEILRQIEGIPDEILHVALQHHEDSAGFGFPQKLPRSKVHSYSKIIHTVGEFIETVYENEHKSDIKLILDHMYTVLGKSISEQVLKSLYIIFNLAPPKSIEALLLPDETSRLV
ncbi:response regulator [bacterium]|nr:response regulator [bacterium]